MVRQAYWWRKDSYIDDQCWFVLQDHLCTLYAPHFLYASEVDCEEPNVEHELELEKLQFSDLVAECKKILASVGKLLASYAAKVDSDLEPPVLIELNIVDKPESEAVNEPKPEPEAKVVDELITLQEEFILPPTEVEELYIGTLVELLVEPIVELVLYLTAIPLRSPDIYDLLQIFLQETRSQETSLSMVQNAISSVFIMVDSHLSAACDWLDLPSFTVGSPRKPVPPPPS